MDHTAVERPSGQEFGQLQHHHQELAKLITLNAPTLAMVACLRATAKCFYITPEELDEVIASRFLTVMTKIKAKYRTLSKIDPSICMIGRQLRSIPNPRKVVTYHVLPNRIQHGEMYTTIIPRNQVIQRMTIRYGVVQGPAKTWYKTGELKREYNNRDGLLNGPDLSWFKDGSIAFEFNWSNGVKSGQQISRYPTGEVREQCFYVNGLLEGRATEFWRDGTIAWDRRYLKDFIHGTSRRFWPSGQRQSEMTFVGGDKYGKLSKWDENGLLIEQYTYVKDKLDGETRVWHPNGQLQFLINYRDDLRHGVSEEYDAGGRMIVLSNWEYNKEHGVYTEWTIDGGRQEMTFANGVLHGSVVVVKKDGTRKETLYDNGRRITKRSTKDSSTRSTRPKHPPDQYRCTDLLKTGERCHYKAKPGRQYCGLHIKRHHTEPER